MVQTIFLFYIPNNLIIKLLGRRSLLSKLGLDIGENRCVIKFSNMVVSGSSYRWDTGTFETPVWWCTKDSDGYFNLPEQIYLILLHQTVNGYISSSSYITIYNSYTGQDIYPLGSPYNYNSNPTTNMTRGSSLVYIEQISKFKPTFSSASAGSTYPYWATVIPL